jgi:hypothetical protein
LLILFMFILILKSDTRRKCDKKMTTKEVLAYNTGDKKKLNFLMLFEKRTRRFILNHGISIVIMSIVLLSAKVAPQIVAPYL